MKYHAVIIGGGHNGLTCGAYLAKNGLSVAILEQKHVVGGCVVTEEVSRGWRINTYSFEHYVIQNTPIISDLNLQRFGLNYYDVEPTIFSPFRDRKYVFFHRTLEHTLSNIERVSKHDAKAYEKFHAKWAKVSRAFGRAALRRPAPLEEILESSEFPKSEHAELIEEMKLSASKILSETFETEYVSSPIAFLGPAAVGQSPDASGTGWLLAWHIGAERLARPLGGSGKLTRALDRAARSFGATIQENKKVSEILVKNGKAIGVRTEDGKIYESDLVVSNADPVQTLLELLPEEQLPLSVRDFVQKIKVSTGFAFKADYLLEELPKYSCMKGRVDSPNESHTAATFISESVDSISKAYSQFAAGSNPGEPALMVAMHSSKDPSLVPRGKQGLVLETRYTPLFSGRKKWSKEMKDAEARRLLEIYSTYCPGVERLVERFVSFSPADMQRDVMIPGGNFMHVDMSLDQMFDSRPARGLLEGYRVSSLEGLYLCGAGTHPGGGVSGIPGRNAALQIIEEKHRVR